MRKKKNSKSRHSLVIYNVEQEEQKVLTVIKNTKSGMGICGRIKILVDEQSIIPNQKSRVVKKIGKEVLSEGATNKRENIYSFVRH